MRPGASDSRRTPQVPRARGRTPRGTDRGRRSTRRTVLAATRSVLRVLQDWIDDILEYRQDVAAGDVDAGEGESIGAVEESSRGTVVIKKVSCGKDNCKCQSGELHSPYKYIVRRQGDSLDWDYKGQYPNRIPCRSSYSLPYKESYFFELPSTASGSGSSNSSASATAAGSSGRGADS